MQQASNAVNDALRPLGVAVNETPMTPERIIHALMGADLLKVRA